MGQVLHGSATTTEAVRRAIQNRQASLMVLAKRHGINPKTVAKWRRRVATADLPTGPRVVKSTVLSTEEEAVIVALRKHTLLPLDDCLYSLQATIPHLTRSSLHRCLQRHDISRIPEIEGEKTAKRKFKSYPIGYFHIDIAPFGEAQDRKVRTEQGKLYLFVAIDRTSKFAFIELHEATTRVSGDFLRHLIAAVPTQCSPTGSISLRPARAAQPSPTSNSPWPTANASGRTHSNTPAPKTTSNIASPSPSTRGPTARSSE